MRVEFLLWSNTTTNAAIKSFCTAADVGWATLDTSSNLVPVKNCIFDELGQILKTAPSTFYSGYFYNVLFYGLDAVNFTQGLTQTDGSGNLLKVNVRTNILTAIPTLVNNAPIPASINIPNGMRHPATGVYIYDVADATSSNTRRRSWA